MTVTTYKWSVKKWHELIETGVLEDKPFELLEGEIIEMSPEGIPHRQRRKSAGLIGKFAKKFYVCHRFVF